MPCSVLAYRVPKSAVRSKSPWSSPGSPAAPFFTSETVAPMMLPVSRGMSLAVSTSLMPWPRAANTPLSGS